MSQDMTRVSQSEVADMIRRCEINGERGLADALTDMLGRIGRHGTMADNYDADEPKASAYSRGLTRYMKLTGEAVAG